MSRKKTLVALGYFDGDKEKAKEIKEKLKEEDEVQREHEEIQREIRETLKSQQEEVYEDLYFCQYCDKFFETEKGRDVHESRWCKEKS